MKFLKIAIILTLISFQGAFAQEKTTKQTEKKVEKVDAKSVNDIKTFDFERIFTEAETYYNAAKNWQKIKCTSASGFVCTKRECPRLNLVENSHMILDKKSEIISLCKDKVCRYYPAEFEQTGVFVNVRVKDSDGILIRVLGDSRFKQISMIGLDAYISNGACESVKNEVKP